MAIKSYNGVAYDDSVDYSAAIEQAKKSGQDTTQLEAARQAKINGKYGGNEPTMYGSDQKYSTASKDTGGSSQGIIDSAVQEASRLSGYDYTQQSNVSTNSTDYNTIGKSNQSGGVLAGIPRDPANANKRVKMGDYTIQFNDLGMATAAIKDGGASATDYIATSHANDTIYHQLAYDAAAKGQWDLASQYINMMADTYQKTGENNGYTTGVDQKAANLYRQELQNQFGYDANAYYNYLYDQAYGAGSAAIWDATGGAIKSMNQLVNEVGADKAQQILNEQLLKNPNVYNNPGSRIEGTTTGGVYASPQVQQAVSIPGLSLSTGNTSYGGHNDMTDFLKDMFAQNLEAELNALKTAHDNNVAELESRNDMIAEQFRAARNQAAAQNALEVQGMNERALATGLNTGTSGQLALSQSMAYQNNLGNLWAQEAQQQAESDRLMAEFLRDYNASVNQATATNNAMLQEAIYKELIRQEEMAAAAEAARLEQERYDREWKYMLEQDELDRQLAYAQLEAKNAPKADPYKPAFDLEEVEYQLSIGNATPGVLKAYEYYHQTPYNPDTAPVSDSGGMEANQYQTYEDSILQTIEKGFSENAAGMVDAIWNTLNDGQKNRLSQKLKDQFNIVYNPDL